MASNSQPDRRAIIDIGSNSLRLVVYEGPARTPFVVHNEKIMVRLGREVAATGRIDSAAFDRALRQCRRFKALLDAAGIKAVRMVATAATRDAENGPELLEELRAIGFAPELLSGEDEARGAAAGVLSAFPGADGIVGDLGGGSLELIDLRQGEPVRQATFPLGILRLPVLRAQGDREFRGAIVDMLRGGGWKGLGAGRPFYLVGGSLRGLGHLDMYLTESALPGVHGYAFTRERINPLREAIERLGPRLAKTVPGISSSRAQGLDGATALLDVIAERIDCAEMVVSTFGLREGLLFEALDPATQRQDPLLAAVADYGRRRGNPSWNGDLAADWIAPLFAGEGPAHGRIRRAACLLAGVDLHPQSETRARHGMELAWLGGWIGLTTLERALLAQTMWSAWSGKGRCPQLEGFLSDDLFRCAICWGEAIRLAERLTGGTSAVLAHARVALADGALTLEFDDDWQALRGHVVEKQLAALAGAMGARLT